MNSQQGSRAELHSLIEIAKEHTAKRKLDAPRKWRAAAEYSRRLMGEVHETTLYCENNVGKALVATGKFAEAIPLLESALRKANALHGYAHPSVEHTCQALARAYKGKSDFASAHKHWIKAATSSETNRGLLHKTTIFCYHQAARCLACAKNFEEALPLFEKVVAATFAMRGPWNDGGYALRDLATCLNQLGRFDEAESVWSRAFSAFQKGEKRTEAQAAFRSMRFAKHRKLEARAANRLAMLDVLPELSEHERQYVVSRNLTVKQLEAVIERLRATYLASEYENASDLRIAVKSRLKQVDEYAAAKAAGCCGSQDFEFEVHEDHDGNKATIMLGFNFGH